MKGQKWWTRNESFSFILMRRKRKEAKDAPPLVCVCAKVSVTCGSSVVILTMHTERCVPCCVCAECVRYMSEPLFFLTLCIQLKDNQLTQVALEWKIPCNEINALNFATQWKSVCDTCVKTRCLFSSRTRSLLCHLSPLAGEMSSKIDAHSLTRSPLSCMRSVC